MEENNQEQINLPKEEARDHEILSQLSPSFLKMTNGYLDYATYVILHRALVGIDGFKPVQRRALFTGKTVTKLDSNKKAGKLVNDTMSIHPHGDVPIYLAVTRMVRDVGYFQTPFFDGKGAFGESTSGTTPSHMRYTELKFSEFANELFNDMDGVNMIPTEDGAYKEPDLLPVTYPSLFSNATSGIAVGLSANIFPYPLSDLCNYTADLEEKGESDIQLVPEFESGGYIVNTPKEFQKIMRTGRGRIKLRGEWEIIGRKIKFTKFPFFTNAPAIFKQIDALNLAEISNIIDSSDDKGQVVVTVKKKEQVESVLHTIIRETDVQMYSNSNIVVIVDGQPKIAGVTELLQDWLNFRKGVLSKSYNIRLDYIRSVQDRYRLYLDLTKSDERVTELIEAIKKGGILAENLLSKWYPNISEDVTKWLLGLSVRNFYNSETNRKRLATLEEEEKDILHDLANLGKLVSLQLRTLANKHKRERKTIITEQDYTFTAKEKEEEAVLPVEVMITPDKFIMKRTYLPVDVQEAGSFRCNSDDIMLMVDTRGRVLRIDLKRVNYTDRNSKGVYIPVYLEVEDDFNLVWATVLEPKKVSFMYRDGNVSVLDLNEWIGLRHTKKIVHQGVSPEANQICGMLDLEKRYTLAVTSLGRVGIFENNFKQKDRRARTKVLRLNTNQNEVIRKVYSLTDIDLMNVLKNPSRYMNKVSLLEYESDLNEEYLLSL